MGAFSAITQASVLNWVLRGAAAVQPTNCYFGLAIGTPDSVNASELGTATGYVRQTVSFAGAASPAGSASNLNAIEFPPFSSAATLLGALLFDSSAGGTYLQYGMLSAPRTFGIGDQIVFSPGGLVVNLG
jgi:hypothetical protein